ncbi:MAG TPA: ABC transporter permease [Candidatus Eisenbacteria bacterium]|nr:ABC transporter permease [Candidatus Eisenbacteria bacterium]
MNAARLGAMVRKEFVQMRRDPATLRLVLVVPLVQTLIFGYAIRTDVRNLPTCVFDQSRTQESRAFVQALAATGNFRVGAPAASYAEALRRVDEGRAAAAVVLPPDYARDLKRGRTAAVQVLVDASDPTASQNAIAAAQLVGQRLNLAAVEAHAAAATGRLPVDVRVRPLYNPALRSAVFIVPGIIGIILSNILIIITALSLVRERETGTLEQLIVTPLARWEIMLGKIAPYVLVGYVQMTSVLIVGHWVFAVPVRGPLLALYAASFLFITANLGLGLFISTLGRTQAQVTQTALLILLPNVLLSGFMFPREAMPPAAWALGAALPLTYYLEVIRGIVLKGVGLRELMPQILALAGFAVAFFAFATRSFHKTLE